MSSRSTRTRIQSSTRPTMIVQTGVTAVASAAGRSQRIEPALHGLADRDRLGDREADRGIDADAGRGRLFDRQDPGPCRRELDLDVRGEARETDPLLEHPFGVRVVGRVRLHRQAALAPTFSDEDRLEHGRAADGHLLDHGPGDLDLGPGRVCRGQLRDPRRPVRPFLAQHLEHDARVRGRAGGTPGDGVLELLERAGVVPVVGRATGNRSEHRAVDEAVWDWAGHRVSPQARSRRATDVS